MKYKLITFALAFLLLLNLSSAVVSFYQETIFLPTDMHITRTANSVFWIEGQYEGVRDIITSNDMLEVEIDYSMYPKTWNEANTNNIINNCTFTIDYFANQLNQSYVFYEETINSSDADVMGKKYFVRIPQKDGINVFMDCYFQNSSGRILSTPTELSIKLPTYECKSCLMYEWLVQQRQIVKAQVIGHNVVSIWSYIRQFAELNFEIIVALFWFFLIVVLLIGISLIFLGIFYLYLFLRKLAREIR